MSFCFIIASISMVFCTTGKELSTASYTTGNEKGWYVVHVPELTYKIQGHVVFICIFYIIS